MHFQEFKTFERFSLRLKTVSRKLPNPSAIVEKSAIVEEKKPSFSRQ
jgi:hypothetical protein